MSVSGRQFGVLIVEDSPADAHLIRTILHELNFPGYIHHAEDGEQAMAFLRREGAYADAPRPDLVLLDLNMPRKDGREVLVEIRADPRLHGLPVVPLTTSADENDVTFCYRAGANAFITKPADLDGFMDCMRNLQRFWFSTATLPEGAR